MTDYYVSGAAAVAKLPASEGGERYFYKGDLLTGVSKTECERLESLGLAKPVDEIEKEQEKNTAPSKVNK